MTLSPADKYRLQAIEAWNARYAELKANEPVFDPADAFGAPKHFVALLSWNTQMESLEQYPENDIRFLLALVRRLSEAADARDDGTIGIPF